jgi:hypothetical protein
MDRVSGSHYKKEIRSLNHPLYDELRAEGLTDYETAAGMTDAMTRLVTSCSRIRQPRNHSSFCIFAASTRRA